MAASRERRLRRLLKQLLDLRERVHTQGQNLSERWKPYVRRASFTYSAFNLACYLALRRRNLRQLQMALVPLGLSSLGRCEAHVLASLDAVIAALASMSRSPKGKTPERPSLKHFIRGRTVIERNASQLLADPGSRRHVRIMVTLPADAGEDFRFVRDLLRRGTDCVRINCAHDSETVWKAMIGTVRRAARQEGRPCTVLMDLCGPRVRTLEVHISAPEQRVREGDHILLRREPAFEREKTAFQAVCSIPEVFNQLASGATVMLNEGKIGARVLTADHESVKLEVMQARAKGERFRPAMGLNFPDTHVRADPLTTKDLADLDFVCRHADLIGYSFVQEPEEVDRLVSEIQRRSALRKGREAPGVIAKIETARAVRNLPELIVHGAGRVPFGVMIARGDLAVEIGYLRIAEIQEEMLWICEAAHVPVIWATQVLQNFNKKGIPSRAEMTDAAMSERADCVMLNKGPFLPEAVSILEEVLVRMQAHQWKKMATFRALHSWDHLWRASSARSHVHQLNKARVDPPHKPRAAGRRLRIRAATLIPERKLKSARTK
ncbi:MAG: pyruvate kinase [Verrucomicrobiales bacterium]|nr:pyruvate kinase [Verrucomicrobiales bacterium]